MGFPRQEYWSGVPVPSPGDHPDPGIKPMSAALARRFFTTEPLTVTNCKQLNANSQLEVPQHYVLALPVTMKAFYPPLLKYLH